MRIAASCTKYFILKHTTAASSKAVQQSNSSSLQAPLPPCYNLILMHKPGPVISSACGWIPILISFALLFWWLLQTARGSNIFSRTHIQPTGNLTRIVHTAQRTHHGSGFAECRPFAVTKHKPWPAAHWFLSPEAGLMNSFLVGQILPALHFLGLVFWKRYILSSQPATISSGCLGLCMA